MLLSALPTGLGPAAPLPDEVLVTVGEVGPDHASLWLRGPDGSTLHVKLAPTGAGGATHGTDALPDPDRDLTARLELSQLEPGRRYAYEVSQAGRVVAGEFVTAPAPGADAPVHLAWSGDLGGAGHCRDVEDGYRIFDVLRARRPDLFLFVGDTIYADQVCGQRPHAPGADFVATTTSPAATPTPGPAPTCSAFPATTAPALATSVTSSSGRSAGEASPMSSSSPATFTTAS